jgi:uncharacterized delta-60 repeat protein
MRQRRRHRAPPFAASSAAPRSAVLCEPLEGRTLLSAATGSITGTVYADPLQTGSPTGNAGLAGRVVYVDLAGNGAYTVGDPSAVTDAAGAYTIGGLAAGAYAVREVVPDGYGQTVPAAAAVLVTVPAGGSVEQDFGNLQLGAAESFTPDFTVESSALQADGKIVIVGYTGDPSAGTAESVVARFFPDGTPDLNFGTAGTGEVVQAVDGYNSDAEDVLVESDGKIVVVGSDDLDKEYSLYCHGYVERFNPDGSADASLMVYTEAFDGDNVDLDGITQLPDGSLLASGTTAADDITSAGPLNSIILDLSDADGSPVTTFGDDPGYTELTLADGSGNNTGSLTGERAVVDPSTGIIYVPGTLQTGTSDLEFTMTAYTSTGVYEVGQSSATGYVGSTGNVAFDVGDAYADRAIVVSQDKVLMVGTAGPDGAGDFALAMLDRDGAGFVPDPSFGTDGQVLTDLGGDDEATDVQELPDGSFLVVGTATDDNGIAEGFAEHYGADGTLLDGDDPSTDLGPVSGSPVLASAAVAFEDPAGATTAADLDAAGSAAPAVAATGVGFVPVYAAFASGGGVAREVDTEVAGPTATFEGAAEVTAAGSTPETIRVQYADSEAVDLRSLGAGNLTVTLPGGAVETPTFVGVESTGDDQQLVADYSLPAPGGGWTAADDGTCTISLAANQVFNTAVAATAVAKLGTFTVDVGGTGGTGGGGTGGTATATVTLTAGLASVGSGTLEPLTATVTGVAGGATPTGSVTFSAGGTALATVPLDSGGTASYDTAALPAGTDDVTAAYAGDGTYAAVTSAPAVVTVVAPAAGAPVLTPSVSTARVPASLVLGQNGRIVVPVVIENTGQQIERGQVTVTVYASTDAALTGDAVAVAPAVHKTLVLKPGARHTVSVTLRGLPTTLANGGQYLLLGNVIDAGGFGQTVATASAITVASPVVDPSLSFERVRAVGKAGRVAVTLGLSNSGNVPLAAAVTLTIYETAQAALPAGGGLPSDAVELAPFAPKRVNVPVGRAVALGVTITAQTLPVASPYYLVAVVTTAATATGAPATSATALDATDAVVPPVGD